MNIFHKIALIIGTWGAIIGVVGVWFGSLLYAVSGLIFDVFSVVIVIVGENQSNGKIKQKIGGGNYKLKRKLAILALLIIIPIAAITVAEYVYQLQYPVEWTVEGSLVLEGYLDGTPWSNGTKIQFGTVNASEAYYFNLTITNKGNINCTVYFTVENLPSGYTLTWAGNSTFLQPNESVSADLVLTVPADPTPATYNCDSYILGEQT